MKLTLKCETPLALEAARLTITTLSRRQRQQISQEHATAIAAQMDVMTDLAIGKRNGRVVIDLDTGLGKTTGVVCWLKAAYANGPQSSVVLCGEKVVDLCGIYRQLVDEPQPLRKDYVAIWHSDPTADVPPTFGPGPLNGARYANVPVLLATHSRLRSSDTDHTHFRFQGRARDLVIYDESFFATELWSLKSPELQASIAFAKAQLLTENDLAAVEELGKLQATIDGEIARQMSGRQPSAMRIEFTEPTHGKLKRVLHRVEPGHEGLLGLLDSTYIDFRMVVDGEGGTITKRRVAIPDEMTKVVVLDASYSVRSVLNGANEQLRKTSETLALKPLKSVKPEIPACIKHYDNVTVHAMVTKGSAKNFLTKQFGKPLGTSWIDREIAKVVASIPNEEPVLIFTFKEDEVNYSGRLRQALGLEGIDTEQVIQIDGKSAPRVAFLTWGKETASNDLRHCRNVILCGALELPRETLGAIFVAESRQKFLPLNAKDTDRLQQGEVTHRFYQALSRGSMRETFVDDHRRTQARPMKAWLFTRHQGVIDGLKSLMPGARWETWEPQVPNTATISQYAKVVTAFKGRLRELVANGVREITIRKLKSLDPALGSLKSSSEWIRAKTEALVDSGWEQHGHRLHYRPASEEPKVSEALGPLKGIGDLQPYDQAPEANLG